MEAVMLNDFAQVSEHLKALKQFCLRAEKQPYIKDVVNGYSARGWQLNQDRWLTFEEATEAVRVGAEVFHSGAMCRVDGIGILLVGNGQGGPQLLGGDLDCVLDPETGDLSPWSVEMLQNIRPFYTEVSPSKCGLRFFVMGKLPGGRFSVTGSGPQDDLPSETMSRIVRLKPKAANKLIKGDPVFNGLEFHESSEPSDGNTPAKHLSITGWRLDEFCYPKEDRTDAISNALRQIISAAQNPKEYLTQETSRKAAVGPASPLPAWVQSMEEYLAKNRLPYISILDVIDTSNFEESGGQLFGPHPIMGSTTGRNLVVDPSQNQYCWMHNGINKGGDAYVWLAHEFCGVPWDVPGGGLLRDKTLLEKVIAVAVQKGLVDPKQVLREPELRSISLEDKLGTVGLHQGSVVEVVMNKDSERFFKWVSDCATLIHTETRHDGVTEFTFTGTGARDGIKVCFTMSAADMADAKKFKGALINAFGSGNRVGTLTFEHVHSMTRNTIKKQRVTTPCWRGNTPLVPGLELANDVEFRLSSITPAKVYDGKKELAADTLKKLISLRKYTPLLVAVILGAPVYAKWFPGDRFGLGLWGISGSHKTTIAKLASAIYGLGYYEDHAVIKHGRNGATHVGAMEALLNAGMLPRIIDNVKSTDPRDAQQYIAIVHAVMEGGEKLRGKKDGGLRKVVQFSTTPIITGETKPDEASTSARVLNLTWENIDDSQALAEIQEDIRNLPIVGYHWLRFLSTCSDDITCGFEAARSKKYGEYISKTLARAQIFGLLP
jgi:hypothetical protein